MEIKKLFSNEGKCMDKHGRTLHMFTVTFADNKCVRFSFKDFQVVTATVVSLLPLLKCVCAELCNSFPLFENSDSRPIPY